MAEVAVAMEVETETETAMGTAAPTAVIKDNVNGKTAVSSHTDLEVEVIVVGVRRSRRIPFANLRATSSPP